MGLTRQTAQSLRAFASVFRNRELRRLQLAGIGSTLGSWAYGVALAVYAYGHGGPKAVGVLYAARWISAAAAAPWLAVYADRLSRRNVMAASDLVRALLLGAMAAIVSGGGPPIAVYVLAVLATVAGTVFDPAEGALLPSLVRTPEELTSANVVRNVVGSVGMFAGPALGGVLLALNGPAAAFVATAAACVWSAACVLRLGRDLPPVGEEEHSRGHELFAGFRTIAHEPALRVVVGLTAVQMLVVGAVEVLIVVVALRVLKAGDTGVAWLNSALGVGCLLGAVAVAALAGRKRLAGDFGLGVLLWGVPLALLAVWTNLGIALLMFVAIGVGNTVADVAGMTLLQRTTPEQVMGRVFGVLESLVFGTLALGAVLVAPLIAAFGPRATLTIAGLLLPAVLVPVWPKLRRIDAAAHVAEEPLRLLGAIPIFAALSPPVLERLASAAAAVTVPAGGAVFEQGDPGDRFYVVAGGRAAVEIDGRTTGALEAGDFFGEIALLRDVPRTATIRAAGELRLYALPREEFIAAVTGHGASLEAAHAAVNARLPATAAS